MRKEKTIQVLVVPADAQPYEEWIPNELEELQSLVGGYIETLRVKDNPRILAIVNEEGVLLGLPNNTVGISRGIQSAEVQQLQGTVVFVSISGENFGSLGSGELNRLKSCIENARKLGAVSLI